MIVSDQAVPVMRLQCTGDDAGKLPGGGLVAMNGIIYSTNV